MNEKNNDKSLKHKKQNSILYRLCGRATLFTSLLLLVLMVLYICGGYQDFMDSTMDMILMLCSFVCIMLTLLSIYGLIDSIVMFIQTKSKFIWFFFAIYFVLMVASPILLIVFRTVNFLSQGIQ